jgi:hypothetical protein
VFLLTRVIGTANSSLAGCLGIHTVAELLLFVQSQMIETTQQIDYSESIVVFVA